jgi:hypothetical protein
MFSSESLGFFFGAASSLFFGQATSFLFGLASLFSFRTHFRFNFCAQSCFCCRAALRFGFSLTSGVLFGTTTRGFRRQSLGFFSSPEAGAFTGRDALDLFFHRAESHLGATAQLVFLGFLPAFGLQVMPLLFRAVTSVLFFGFAQGAQLSVVRFLRCDSLCFDFGAASVFHRAHALQFLFRPA